LFPVQPTFTLIIDRNSLPDNYENNSIKMWQPQKLVSHKMRQAMPKKEKIIKYLQRKQTKRVH